MNVVFLYREQLVCLFFIITAQGDVKDNIRHATCVCLSASEIYPKKESSKVKTEKMVYEKKLKPKTRKMKTMKNV